jgi:hypothetical protein
MRLPISVVLMSLVLWIGAALAAPPKPSAKELSQEARTAFDQADKELDPTKANELRMSACDKWEAAFTLSTLADYQLALGLCYQKTNLIPRSEAAFRIFLALAPLTHPNRSVAEQALLQMEKEQNAQKQRTPPSLLIKDPVPIQETSTQWKRRVLFAGGALGGLGLIAGAVAAGVLLAQNSENREIFVAVEKP